MEQNKLRIAHANFKPPKNSARVDKVYPSRVLVGGKTAMIGVEAPRMRMSGQTTVEKEREKEQKEYKLSIARPRFVKK